MGMRDMESRKEEKKDSGINSEKNTTNNDGLNLDGKRLHDLYRHTTKLIK